MTTFNDESTMLTLAALTYRGFQDVLGGRVHQGLVSGALMDGLSTLAPVKDQWELVWGPTTDRGDGVVDSNMMYVVRSRQAAHRLVVAIRGTNPISFTDWVFGDLWVGEKVDWPYASPADPAAISKSTALGLRVLQGMRSPAPATGAVSDISAFVTGAFARLARAARGPANVLAATPAAFDALIKRIGDLWQSAAARTDNFRDRRRAAVPIPIAPADLRPKLAAETLASFLRVEAGRSGGTPLEVVVVGHSKGGAL